MKILDAYLKFRKALKKRRSTKTIVIHHTVGIYDGPEPIHRYHRYSKGWIGIGYNFVIDRLARVWKGRGLEYQGAHCTGSNSSSIGIAIICNAHGNKAVMPTDEQLESTAELARECMKKYPSIKAIKKHKDMPYARTACPGNKFPWDKLIDMIYNETPTEKSKKPKYSRLLIYRYKNYMRGNDVKEVQRVLKALRLYTGSIDGVYGPKTKRAVRKFQYRKHILVDGKVGKQTWGRLFP